MILDNNDDDLWQDREKLEIAFAELGRRIHQQQSERSQAIVGGVELEESMGDLLSSFFVDNKETERMLENIFGDFFVRINVAWVLGLISRDEFDDLHLIREIRNHFAHSRDGSTFTDKYVSDRCAKLKTIRKNNLESEDGLMLYLGSVVVLKELLFERKCSAALTKRTPPAEIDPSKWRDI